MSLEYFQTLTSYNVWANTRITGYIKTAGDAVVNMEQQSSFPTILKTIIHIWGAETIWLSRLQGESLKTWPTTDLQMSSGDACSKLVSVSELFNRYVHSLNDDQLMAVISYKNLKGEPFENTVRQIVSHCMNHSTYHRGQLVTMLRGAGFTALGSTDMINYYREQS